MKFHLLSNDGSGCALMKRIRDEGNECTVQIEASEYRNTFNGILDKVSGVPNGSLVIVDSSGMGKEADALKKRGFKVFGGSKFADRLEEERDFGLSFMQEHGIKIPDTKTFKTFSQAIDWVKEQKGDDRYVFKPNGEYIPCKLTYCATDNDDLISYLRFVQRHFSAEIDDFILQTFIEGPIVSTEFWVGPNGFIRPANHTVEVKKFLNDDLGPSTGCQGNLVWIADDDEVVRLLEGIEGSLIKEGYIGPIDLNAILSEQGPRGLEWTPRFGLDAMPTLLHLVEGKDIGQIISDIVHGETKEMGLYDAISAGVRITIPPYPIEPIQSLKKVLSEAPNVGVPIRGLSWNNTYFYEVMDQDNELVHAPGTGIIGVVIERGDDAREILDEVRDVLDDARIPDKQYRTDLSDRLPEMCEEACEALEYATT